MVGDSTPLGQRPLCVLTVVYRVCASARMVQLDGCFKSCVPGSVKSAGSGRSSVEAWYNTTLDIEEVLAGAVDSHVLVLLLMSSSPVILLIGVFQIGFLEAMACPPGFVMLTWSIMRMFASGLSLLLGLVSVGLVMGVFLKVVR